MKSVVVFGAGQHFRDVLLPVLNSAGVRVVAVVDPFSVVELNQDTSTLWDEAEVSDRIRNFKIDGAIISSPTARHAEHAKLALDAGIPVYIEKPMTSSYASALELTNRKQHISVNEQRRHREDVALVMGLTHRRRFGHLRHVGIDETIAPRADFVGSWRNRLEDAGGGVLMDLGIHSLTMLAELLPDRFPSANNFSCQTFTPSGYGVETEVTANFDLAETVVTTRFALDGKQGRERLKLDFTEGTVELERTRGEQFSHARFASHGEHWKQIVPLSSSSDEQCLRNFLAGKDATSSFDRQLEAIALIETLYSAVRVEGEHVVAI